ncbi:MAG TPA: hypothetical protein VE010_19230, partial [Thermoanaerobaculia bacterium]|nr:hypothetical protein [Thermoanaerobaculia bacterium]
MSARKRFLLIFVITLAVAGAGFGYLFGRMHRWHDRGWTGASFYPEMPSWQRTPTFGAKPGDVLMVYGGSPADGRLLPYDRVTHVNGIPIRDAKRLRALDRSLPGHSVVTYTVLRQGKQVHVPVRIDTPLRSPYIVLKSFVAFCVALVFIGVAVIVFMRRPEDERVIVFYAFALVSAIAVLGGAATVYEAAGGRGLVPTFGVTSFGPVFFVSIAIAYAPLVLHLALIFPRRRPILERHPHLIRALYAFALLCVLLFLLCAVMMLMMMADPIGTHQSSFGRNIGRGMFYVAIAGLLLALHISFLGRKDGLIRAFASRPFRSVFAVFAIFIGLTMVLGRYASDRAGMVVGFATILLPICVLALYPVSAAIALVRSYRSAGVEEKRQVQWPLWGLIIALSSKIAGFALAAAGAFALGAANISPIHYRLWFQAFDIVPMIVSLLIPVSFAAAILKYRLMNIDVIIRKT